MASKALSKNRIIPKNRKNTPNPVKPTPISVGRENTSNPVYSNYNNPDIYMHITALALATNDIINNHK